MAAGGRLGRMKAEARDLLAGDLAGDATALWTGDPAPTRLASLDELGGGPVGVDPLPVLLQVNISGEESKGGFEPSEVSASLPTLLSLPFLRVVGLMTMAPFTEDEEVIRRTFRGLRELQEKLKESFPAYEGIELSMGMSNDFELAVEEGSTILRLGTVLFGERPA
jgi:pyridoxal phosphate enzyme (YggS family)